MIIILGAIETEHVEMGWYESLMALAKKLDSPEIIELLKSTCDEEKKAAEGLVNLI